MENQLLNDELKMMRSVVKKFVENEVVKAEIDEGALMKGLPNNKIKQLQDKAKKMGIWAFGAKEKWGGIGLDLFSRVVLMEEAAKHRIGFFQPAADAFGKEIPTPLHEHINESIEPLVIKAVENGNGCFLAFTEEQGGSRLENCTSTAKKEGKSWMVNGKKRYVTNAVDGEFGFVLVKCIENDENKGLTLFVVPQSEKIKRKKIQLIKSIETYDLEFDQVKVSDDYRIGHVGEGLAIVKKILNEQQLLASARAIGVASQALDLAVEWASSRVTFRKKLKDRQAIQWMIADSVIELRAARYMLWDAAKKVVDGVKTSVYEVDMAKLICTETAFRVIDRCIQIHGGMGVAQELPLERWYREVRTSRLDLGNSEVLRENIANFIFKKQEVVVS